MSHPIDVGSVLGGRYKVTATVLTSHDQDLVLDGVDQVLNRAVSILVAGPGNADQVAHSAREVATGERPGSVQILDLGVSDDTTYLITNHASAADLLDLVVSANPPYVEPFFTDTLGSEIFGQPRSSEPETYDGLYDEEDVDAGYINYGTNQPPAAPPAAATRMPSRPTAGPAAGAAAIAGGAAASTANAPATAPQEAAPQVTAPQPVQGRGPGSGERGTTAEDPAESPKVSLWSDDDYDHPDTGNDRAPRQNQAGSAGTGSAADRAPGFFPGSARNTEDPAAEEDYDTDDEPRREPRSMRWLVGGLLAAVLVVGLVLAVTNLGGLFKSTPQPAAGGTSSTVAPSPTSTETSASASPSQAAGPPAVEGVTRLGNFDFAATYDGDLVKTVDGNGASYWSDMEFATENWGGLASEVPLVVKLKAPAKVSSVTLSQLGASGGNISVYTNDRPSLDGAKKVGSNSFTSPDLTMPLPEPATAQYVIVSIESLPKLAAPKTRYGFGLRLAEIKVQ
ncbi:ABC transporter substrate-binding protein [Arthrobacter sp. H16F315]|uniref:ABC transporter substrate-binding protein n=1 Tax=Arthrobacter sp. H16F315 TaxID=2955314 RepID=UPI0020981033|nr:ABC transporter substrate-binding protein [Arthrobacter sp. H16F315]